MTRFSVGWVEHKRTDAWRELKGSGGAYGVPPGQWDGGMGQLQEGRTLFNIDQDSESHLSHSLAKTQVNNNKDSPLPFGQN